MMNRKKRVISLTLILIAGYFLLQWSYAIPDSSQSAPIKLGVKSVAKTKVQETFDKEKIEIFPQQEGKDSLFVDEDRNAYSITNLGDYFETADETGKAWFSFQEDLDNPSEGVLQYSFNNKGISYDGRVVVRKQEYYSLRSPEDHYLSFKVSSLVGSHSDEIYFNVEYRVDDYDNNKSDTDSINMLKANGIHQAELEKERANAAQESLAAEG